MNPPLGTMVNEFPAQTVLLAKDNVGGVLTITLMVEELIHPFVEVPVTV